MKLTLSWLKEHLDTSASLADIVETLTRIGLEVEDVHNPAAQLAAFKIAQVLDAQRHPNADKLQVCMVDVGEGAPVQVVCGAPNARTGLKTVFSPPGTYIPAKKITIAKGVIRGVESAGMLCSAGELDIAGDERGIIELPANAPVGEPYAQWAGLDDPVIEINLTPNRPDAAGVYGVARDLAAAGLGTLKTEDPAPIAGKFPCPVGVTLDLGADAHLAPLFALRLVRGVRNGSSPEWMQKRLREIGLRPINALVDITNFLTFDRARPLHVFDAKKVSGDLVVRRARAGETLLALDGKTYELDDAMIVICDDNGPESLAGVMGGEASGCDETTTDVLIESALWDPRNIAHTGRKLGVVTDARYRFERGVDPDFTLPGMELATQLVLTLCGGEPSDVVVAGAQPSPPRAITFPWSETRRLTGAHVMREQASEILTRLGFEIESGAQDIAHIAAPSWRPDIEGKADIVEEIIRMIGVDNVPSTPLPRAEGVAPAVLTLMQKRARTARRALAAQGLIEAVTWSFIAHEQAQAFGGGGAELTLANPIASDLSDMRPSLLPGLVAATGRNAARGLGDQNLFEVGQIFLRADETGQRLAAAGARRGLAGAGRHWSGAARRAGAFEAKDDALALLGALGVSTGGLQIVAGGPPWMHPGRSATLQFGPKAVIGHFGEIHPRALKTLDVEGPVAAFEIILDMLPAPKAKPTKMKPKLEISDLQPVSRDFAFIVDRTAPAGDLVRAVASADKALIAEVGVFDVYEGVGAPEGKKSVGVAVTLQPRDRTLTDAEIEAVAQKIVTEAGRKCGATLR